MYCTVLLKFSYELFGARYLHSQQSILTSMYHQICGAVRCIVMTATPQTPDDVVVAAAAAAADNCDYDIR